MFAATNDEWYYSAIVKSDLGTGKAQGPIELQHGNAYYSGIRVVNGAGHVIESYSDGITVDQSVPRISVLGINGINETEVSTNT